MAQTIAVRRDDSAAVVTLASPGNRNALTTELLSELIGALTELDADPAVRAIVLTGGTEVFASGADVRELLAITPAEYLASPRAVAWRRLMAIGTPMVSAVAGHVLGGGCELAFCADLVVAADTAVFGQPEIRLGILPGAGGTQRWARVVGRYRAAEVVLLGRSVDAFTARRLGLVHRVTPRERVVDVATSVARTLTGYAPLATRQARTALRHSEELPLSAALEFERLALISLLSTEDKAEGITAFLEKRRPHFSGR